MLSKFFIERPVLANVLSIIMVVLGIVAVFSLPVSQYPNIVPPTVMVTARYPGASPQTIVDTVALPIELQVNGVDGMLYMQSTAAADGTYQLIITFKIGVDPDQAQLTRAKPRLKRACTTSHASSVTRRYGDETLHSDAGSHYAGVARRNL